MKTSLLTTLTLGAAIAFGGVSLAKADEAGADAALKAKPRATVAAVVDTLTTASIGASGTGADCGDRKQGCTPAQGAASRYPVNALEGLNLGW